MLVYMYFELAGIKLFIILKFFSPYFSFFNFLFFVVINQNIFGNMKGMTLAIRTTVVPTTLLIGITVVCIHVIPPSSPGRLQEMSHKIGKNSLKKYHFLTKIQNLPEMNWEFSYIFYTFFKNLPEMEERSP